jgi:hypothetical protein
LFDPPLAFQMMGVVEACNTTNRAEGRVSCAGQGIPAMSIPGQPPFPASSDQIKRPQPFD